MPNNGRYPSSDDKSEDKNFEATQLGQESLLDAPHHDTIQRHFIERIWGIPPVPQNPDPVPKPGTSPIPARADHVHLGQFGIKARRNSINPAAGPRPQINFIENTGITITLADDPATGEIDVGFAVTGDAETAVQVRHNNVNVGTRPSLNFLDTTSIKLTVTDDPGPATEVEISGIVDAEWFDDVLTLALIQGFGVTITHNEGTNQFTFEYNLQDWFNLLRLSLLEGTNIDIVPDNVARTLTINSTASGGGSSLPGIISRVYDFNQSVNFSTSDNLSISRTEIFPATTYNLVAWTVRCGANLGGTGIIVNVVKNGSTAGQPSASLTSGDLYNFDDAVPQPNTGTADTPATPGTTWAVQAVPQVGGNVAGMTVTLFFRPVLP